MKHWWREELQLPVTIKRSFFLSTVAINHKNFSRDIRSFYSFRSKYITKVISCLKSFSLTQYHLWSLSSVFLMKMFDLRGKELKYAKELLLNYYRNEVAGHVGRVKTVVTNHLRKMFRNRINKAAECNTSARINWVNQYLMLSQTFSYWDKQQYADSNTIQLHLTVKCTKDPS